MPINGRIFRLQIDEDGNGYIALDIDDLQGLASSLGHPIMPEEMDEALKAVSVSLLDSTLSIALWSSLFILRRTSIIAYLVQEPPH